MTTSATVVNFKDNESCLDLQAQKAIQLIESATTIKQHLAAWEQGIDNKLTAAEQAIDKQLMQIQMVIAQFNKTLQASTNQEWQQASATIHSASQQQTMLLQETCTELKKTTKEMHVHVERATQQITKNLNSALRGLQASELQQLVDDSAEEVKKFSATVASQISTIVKWFHWKNLGLVFLLSLAVTLLVSLYIDDEWPWETHKVALKQRLAGQALLTAWPQLTQLDRQQIEDDFA